MTEEVIKRDRHRIANKKKLVLTTVFLLAVIPAPLIIGHYTHNFSVHLLVTGLCAIPFVLLGYFVTKSRTKKSLQETMQLKKVGIRTKATVIGKHIDKMTEDSFLCHCIVYEFVDQSSKTHKIDAGNFYNKEIKKLELGDEMDVIYDPNNPHANYWVGEIE